MPKFRKKPVVIEAWCYTGPAIWDDENSDHPEWLQDAIDKEVIVLINGETQIVTIEGMLHVSDGDWIIKGVKGELYPCKPDIFAATYEAVDDLVPMEGE